MPAQDDRFDERYSRQLLLRMVGPSGQRRLGQSTALVVGCGALGSRQAELLTRAGMGSLRIVDRDVVELSNLPRQTLFDEADVAAGRPKAEAAARHLPRINSDVRIDARVLDVTAANVAELLADVDVVLDATDNFETRYLLNDICVQRNVPWIYGGVVEASGMTMAILPGETPCLRCIFPDPPTPGSVPTTGTIGILNTLPALIAARQVTEALKVLLDPGAVNRRLVQLDLWDNDIRQLTVAREPRCPTCVERRFEFLDGSRDPGA
ncbi:MAG: ThiF family adenylyltransferase [bacterium]